MGKPTIPRTCACCGSEFLIPKSRIKTAKYCSNKCAGEAARSAPNARCAECGIELHKKPYSIKKAKFGSFCSVECSSKFKTRAYIGDGNPNFKNRLFDSDGYRIYSPQASLAHGFGRIKEHHAVTFLTLGIRSLPNGMHVHHRNCDPLDNSPENLQLLTIPDHKWLHKQYGSAAMRAIVDGRVGYEEASLWSDDPARALMLLSSNLHTQKMLMDLMNKLSSTTDWGVISAIRPIRAELVEAEV